MITSKPDGRPPVQKRPPASATLDPIGTVQSQRSLELQRVMNLEALLRSRRDNATGPVIALDHPRDTLFAHESQAMSKVLHVFHHEWVGIRSACGSLPGRKLAVTADKALTPPEVSYACDLIELQAPSQIVFHGFSHNSRTLIERLARTGLSSKLHVVMHGSSPQWCFDADRAAITSILELAKSGEIRKFAIMKAGQNLRVNRQHHPMLYNMSLNMPGDNPLRELVERDQTTAFVPGWMVLHKNIYTNLLGALNATKIQEVWTYSDNRDLGLYSNKPTRRMPAGDQMQLLMHARLSSICLNVSLLDCHPMVNIEAQSVGRPCVRGKLNLDAHEDHDYVKLTEVSNACSIDEVASVIDRCLEVPAAEMQGLIADYQAAMDRVALERYSDFLGL